MRLIPRLGGIYHGRCERRTGWWCVSTSRKHLTPHKARIAEEAGACAVMALERVPADIRATGGVARMVGRRMKY